MSQGGSTGARLLSANLEQLREELLRIGLLTPAEAGYRTDRKYGWAAVTS